MLFHSTIFVVVPTWTLLTNDEPHTPIRFRSQPKPNHHYRQHIIGKSKLVSVCVHGANETNKKYTIKFVFFPLCVCVCVKHKSIFMCGVNIYAFVCVACHSSYTYYIRKCDIVNKNRLNRSNDKVLLKLLGNILVTWHIFFLCFTLQTVVDGFFFIHYFIRLETIYNFFFFVFFNFRRIKIYTAHIMKHKM